jgi:uncharacterized membrane protein/mono/diheme cytochrome c family protein
MTLTILVQLSDWALFIGRFHPLLVHLPIGFLVIALLLEVGQRLGKLTVAGETKSLILLASAIGATLSCAVGLLLASGGGYDEDALGQHKWQGIGVAVFAWIAWFVSAGIRPIRLGWLSALYAPAFFLSVLLMFTTGHIGGGLTHGEDYLTQYAPNPLRAMMGLPPREEGGDLAEIKPLLDVNQAVVYDDIVQPILTTRCVQCHGKSKKKGDLRLDSYAELAKGGDGGPVFVSGKGQESTLVKVCLLPMEDDMHMPPKGKTQLTEAQIGLIAWWIDQGASKDKKVADLEKTEEISESLLALGSAGSESSAASKGVDLSKIVVAEADLGVVSELRKLNLIVSPVSKDQNILEVSAINAPTFSDAQAVLLQKMSDQIVWLKVGGTAVTDKAMKEIAGLKHLNKLYLEHTAISDEGIAALSPMANLEYLNLIGTKVSDASIAKLAELKSLRSLYLWKSAITDSGIVELKKLRPDLHVVGGLTEQEVQDFLNAGKKDSLGTSAKAE